MAGAEAGASIKNGNRSLRDRKERKLYADDWMVMDDEETGRKFRIEDKIESPDFPTTFVKEMDGYDFTLAHIQRNGFHVPILFPEKTGLGLRVPDDDFDVHHVRMCVGSKRLVDVMDVSTQKNHQMTMREWSKYYSDPDKDRLLNVISLEFSHTKMDEYVTSPTIVRQLDWVDSVWPIHLKDAQVEATNAIDDMMYPKVQKYCLMSVKGCYTDFHIDFGGTSVWYHILKGQKIFWLIPPTDKNLLLYENWVLSGKQSDIFFGDKVEKCSRIRLYAGNTFFIPSGWIHAVFTPEDSLVFGGNFLHSFAIDRQIECAKVEDSTRVPQKFRYPFFTEMLWYVMQRYVYALLGKNHMDGPEDDVDLPFNNKEHVHLTSLEISGLRAVIFYLHSLPAHKKNVPDYIKNPIELVKDLRYLVDLHRGDDAEAACTGRSILTGIDDSDVRPRERLPSMKQDSKLDFKMKYKSDTSSYSTTSSGNPSQNSPTSSTQMQKLVMRNLKNGGPRRRRTRCKKCEACQRSDCGECSFCLDMVKFGGPGRAKQTCVMRQCLQPMLPVTAACAMCGLDGWGQQPVIPIQKTPRETPSALMECSVCYDIAHPDCYLRSYPGIDGVPNDDLPNSWECPRCCKAGRNREYRPRHFRARQKSTEVRRMSLNSDPLYDNEKCEVEVETDSADEDTDECPLSPDAKRMKMIKDDSLPPQLSPKMDIPTSPDNDFYDDQLKDCEEPDELKKLALRTQIPSQYNAYARVLKKPTFVIRPAAPRAFTGVHEGTNLVMERSVMVPIFSYMTPKELVTCALVCRNWARFSMDSSLWRRMDLSHRRLTAAHLAGIARRQPEVLWIDWSHIAKKQLKWLIGRLPQLRGLSAQGCSWSGISALGTCVCPPLHFLDLSFVGGLNDSSLRDILSPPADSRPGLTDTRTRLRHLRCLKIAGCDITDVSLRYITQHLPRLSVLDISSCTRLTDAGVAQLATPSAPTIHSLTCVNISNLRSLTDVSIDHITRLKGLVRLNLGQTPHISDASLERLLLVNDRVQIMGRE